MMRSLHKLRNFLQPGRAERELAREMQSHLALLQDEFQRRGMSEEEARFAAKRAIGGVEQSKELQRDERSWFWLEQLRQDVRFAARALLKSPGFAMTAILTLALGIGANTAIFSLIDALMLRSLPVNHPEQLMQVTVSGEEFFANPLWEQLRDRQDAFSGIFGYSYGRFNLAAGGEAHYVMGNYVSGDIFETLGLRATIGRTFTPADDRRGCPGTAVLSYGFWRSEYGGRPDVVGKTISLDNHSFEILGVLPPGFTGVDVGSNKDLFVPICSEKIIRGNTSVLDMRNAGWIRVVGRPKPGISSGQAEASLKTLSHRVLAATVPEHWKPDQQDAYRKGMFETRMAENGLSFLRKDYRQPLTVLMGIVGLVLLIACANVANLLLARSAARQREIAIRMALGSGRGRLMRQLLTESLMLSFSGAALGILFAQVGAHLLVRLISSNNNRVFLDLSVDTRVLAFTAGVAMLTTILFGLLPAWRGTRVDPQSAMKANARGVIEGGRFGVTRSLVVVQVALSLVLLVGAGLMLATFFRLETLDAGFEREHVLLAGVDLRNGHYVPARRHAVIREMLERLRAIPGVRSASASTETPIDGNIDADDLEIEGYRSKGRTDMEVFYNQVSEGFFETLGTDLLAGRDFNSHDTPESPKVAIVNEAMAKKFFAGRNPVGKRYRSAGGIKPGAPVEIVGVVKNAKYVDLRENSRPIAYVALGQDGDQNNAANFEIRVAAGVPTDMIAAVKSSIGSVNPNVTLEFSTLGGQVDESLARERLLATLSAFFGGLALLLAMVGLYGVTSYNVTRRRNEIGIRMALGAGQSRVLRMVLTEVAVLVVSGLGIGLTASYGTSRFIQGLLYGVKPGDARTLVLAVLGLSVVAAAAGYLPARKAARLEPMNALREE